MKYNRIFRFLKSVKLFHGQGYFLTFTRIKPLNLFNHFQTQGTDYSQQRLIFYSLYLCNIMKLNVRKILKLAVVSFVWFFSSSGGHRWYHGHNDLCGCCNRDYSDRWSFCLVYQSNFKKKGKNFKIAIFWRGGRGWYNLL